MFPCLTLVIFCLNLIQMIKTINGTRCYTCQTAPERIICSIQTECNGKGCYVIMDGKNNVAGCTSDINPTTREVGCFNETSTRKICACYTNFCNTPIGTVSFVSLPYSPLTANITAPWDIGFSPNSTTTSTTVASTTTTMLTTTIPAVVTTTKIPSTILTYSPSTLKVSLVTTPSSIQTTTTKNSSIQNSPIFVLSVLVIITLIFFNKYNIYLHFYC